MKKILSLVLVIALVLGSFSFAFAATAPAAAPADVTDPDQQDAVNVLMALNVVNGYPDGTYKPTKVVTRAEMAKLLITELGYGDLVSTGTANFSDTAGHWAEGQIALASGLGLVIGYPDGSFKPDATVSFDEAITMTVRALGYSDASLVGAWPTNYKIKALNLDLLADVVMAAKGADRGNIAIMLYNALFLAYGEINADDIWVVNTDGTGNDAKLIIDKIGKLVEGYTFTYNDLYDTHDMLDTVIDLTDYLFYNVDYYENNDGDIAYISDINSEVVMGDHTTVSGQAITTQDSADDWWYPVVNTGLTDFGGLYYNYDTASTVATFVGADVTLVYLDADDNGDLDTNELIGVIGTEINSTEWVASDYDEDDTSVDTVGGFIDLPLDDGDLDLTQVSVMGDVTTVADIMEDDVIEVYASEGYTAADDDMLTLVVTRDTVTGTITEVNTEDDTVTIDGVELDYSSSVATVNYYGSGDLDTDQTVYLNAAGEIAFMSDVTSTPSDYAVVVAASNGDTSATWSEVDLDTAPQIKLFNQSGDVVIYDIDTDDFDFVVGTSESHTVGDLTLNWAGLTTSAIIVTGVSNTELVLYKLDSDGVLTDLVSYVHDANTSAATAAGSTYDEPILNNTAIVGSSTIIFDITTGTNGSDWEVIGMNSLDPANTALITYTYDGDDVVAMTVNDNSATTAGTYAIFTKVTSVVYGGDTVDKGTGFVDGVAMTMYSDDLGDIVSANTVLELTLDGTTITTTTEAAVTVTGVITSVVGNLVKVGSTFYELTDDAVVYSMVYDAGDVDSVSIGSMSNVKVGAYIEIYDTNEDTTDGYELAVVVAKANYASDFLGY